MTILSSRVDVVGTTAIASGDVDVSSVLLRNKGTATVAIGAADVTINTGFRLDATETLSADLHRSETLYGVVASGTVSVDVLQSGLG